MKKTMNDWAGYFFLGALALSLLGLWLGLMDNRSFGLVILLLAGLNQLWTAWSEYQKEKAFNSRVTIASVIGIASLGLLFSSFL